MDGKVHEKTEDWDIMGSYVEKNLGRNEVVVMQGKRNGLFLVGTWIKGILLCWLLLIPLIQAIIKTVEFNKAELALTNKRVVGKTGVFSTKTLDAPLNKIQNVSEEQSFWGKMFHYSTLTIKTSAGEFSFECMKSGAEFKNAVMQEIDRYDDLRIMEQGRRMAEAMYAPRR